jgi:hypothetical protein
MAQYLLDCMNVKTLDVNVHHVDSFLVLALLDPSQNALVFTATLPSAQVNLLRGPPEDGIQPREKFSSAAFRHLNEPMRQAAGSGVPRAERREDSWKRS